MSPTNETMTTARDVIAEWIVNRGFAPPHQALRHADKLIDRFLAESSVHQELAALLNPWRPMNTFPKDSWFLVCDKKKECEIVHSTAVEAVGIKTWIGWLPLPAPPSEDKT